ncbi:MAG: glutaredoxin family protein [Betaproteobacteria bacterium]|nr:glutaredoxin family protein [Betaproteobacteria bacterium]MDH5219694.1 glutaredoxin family protein [Betaproteobacteria bacterium]MDH5350739.1 glutaredoxin family protein [Betaproteobacteria bacterium]
MRSLIFLTLLGTAIAASAQLYRWTDENGRVHITDVPPPPSARNVQPLAASGAPAAGTGLPYALQLAVKNAPVTLYTAPDCPPCGEARALLNARGLPFREISVVDEQQAEELKKTVGSLSVPSIRVGSSVQKGYEQGLYDALLDGAGYPRAGLLPPRSQAEPKPAPAAAPKPPAEQSAAEDEEDTGRPGGPYVPR